LNVSSDGMLKVGVDGRSVGVDEGVIDGVEDDEEVVVFARGVPIGDDDLLIERDVDLRGDDETLRVVDGESLGISPEAAFWGGATCLNFS